MDAEEMIQRFASKYPYVPPTSLPEMPREQSHSFVSPITNTTSIQSMMEHTPLQELSTESVAPSYTETYVSAPMYEPVQAQPQVPVYASPPVPPVAPIVSPPRPLPLSQQRTVPVRPPRYPRGQQATPKPMAVPVPPQVVTIQPLPPVQDAMNHHVTISEPVLATTPPVATPTPFQPLPVYVETATLPIAPPPPQVPQLPDPLSPLQKETGTSMWLTLLRIVLVLVLLICLYFLFRR